MIRPKQKLTASALDLMSLAEPVSRFPAPRSSPFRGRLRVLQWLASASICSVSPAALAQTAAAAAPGDAASATAPPTDPAGDASASASATAPADTAGSAETPVASVPASPGPPLDAQSASPIGDEAEPSDQVKKQKAGGSHSRRNGFVTLSNKVGRIQIKGRVIARAELQHQQRQRVVVNPDIPEGQDGRVSVLNEGFNSLDLSIASVRVGFEYQAPIRWISAVAEAELTQKTSLKDGYVQAKGQNFFARAGQFKMPASAIDSESPWVLPLARRGLINGILLDWLDVAGRRPGVMAGWRGRNSWHPRISLGAFQASTQQEIVAGDRDTSLIREASLDAQSLIARAEIEVAGVGVGAWYEHRVGSPELNTNERYFTAGADVTVNGSGALAGLRVWLDAVAGASWYEHILKASDEQDATFVAARALVAYRFGGVGEDDPYVEPFGFFGAFEPDRDTRNDLAIEGALGINAGFWQRARLTLQAEINQTQTNFPKGAGGYFDPRDPDRKGLLLQAGVAW